MMHYNERQIFVYVLTLFHSAGDKFTPCHIIAYNNKM